MVQQQISKRIIILLTKVKEKINTFKQMNKIQKKKKKQMMKKKNKNNKKKINKLQKKKMNLILAQNSLNNIMNKKNQKLSVRKINNKNSNKLFQMIKIRNKSKKLIMSAMMCLLHNMLKQIKLNKQLQKNIIKLKMNHLINQK